MDTPNNISSHLEKYHQKNASFIKQFNFSNSDSCKALKNFIDEISNQYKNSLIIELKLDEQSLEEFMAEYNDNLKNSLYLEICSLIE